MELISVNRNTVTAGRVSPFERSTLAFVPNITHFSPLVSLDADDARTYNNFYPESIPPERGYPINVRGGGPGVAEQGADMVPAMTEAEWQQEMMRVLKAVRPEFRQMLRQLLVMSQEGRQFPSSLGQTERPNAASGSGEPR